MKTPPDRGVGIGDQTTPVSRGRFFSVEQPLRCCCTIAAISTPPGTGGVSIVRLSGPEALAVGDRIVRLRRGGTLAGLPGWSVALGEVVDPRDGKAVDEVIVVVMRGPHSYTSEDVLEIQCHGGRLVSEKILALVLGSGARAAEAGEFTRRAFLSGRITLEEAESVLDLVNAPSESSLKAAGKRLKGELGSRIRDWEARLLAILADLVLGRVELGLTPRGVRV